MRRALPFLALLLCVPAFAVEDETRALPNGPEPFSAEVYRARRQKLMAQLKKGVAVILSATREERSREEHQSPDFAWLTGLPDETDAALLLIPEAPPDRRELLLLGPFDPERDRWSGYRAMLPNHALETRLGFSHLGRADRLGETLAVLAQKYRELHFFGPIVGYKQDVPRALELVQKTSQRVPGSSVKDAQTLLGRLRMAKEPRELDKIARATDITVAGHLEAMKRVRPGMREWDLKRILEDEFKARGAHRLSYSSIVGAGPDGCLLHYVNDDRVIGDGELVLIDAAAEVDHYATDVTRTFPASGKFTPEQRKVYEVVLAAQKAAIARVKPGVTWDELRAAAEKVITDAGYYDYFIHGLGHPVGLEVHDLGPWASFEPLVENAVITIEPGIYIPEKKLGIRIEDTIVVTKTGARNLSAALPREPDEIERLMASAPRTK